MININVFYSRFWMKNEVGIKTGSVSLASEATFILVLQALTVINQRRWFISSFPYTLLTFWLKDYFSDLPQQQAVPAQVLESFSRAGDTNSKIVAQL